MSRKSFTFYVSFRNAAKKLCPEDRLALYDAIIAYGLDKEKLSISGIPEAMFELVLPNLDSNWKKYEDGCKGAEHGVKGKEYGVKGGNPNLKKGKPNPYYQNEGEDNPPHNPPHNPPNKDKDKERDNNLHHITSEQKFDFAEFSLPCDRESWTERISALQTQERWKNISYELVALWNAVAEKFSLPCAKKERKGRWQAVRKLLTTQRHSPSDLYRAVEIVTETPFLLGSTKDEFKVSLDWLLQPTKFPKVLNGEYREWT